MTAQVREDLLYEGKQVSMCSTPLGDYLTNNGIFLPLRSRTTACNRNYIGKWEITDNRLYLIGIDAKLRDGTPVSVVNIFPDSQDRVFASWYTGTLRIPQGDRIKYFHGGFASVYERDLFLDINQGVLVDTRLQHNSVSENALDN
jgi:hypothetical protein